MKKTIIGSVVVLLVGVLIGFAVTREAGIKASSRVGLAPGTGTPTGMDNVQLTGSLYAGEGVVEGGINASSTYSAGETANPADLLGYTLIDITPTKGAFNLTLFASTTVTATTTANGLFPQYLGLLNPGDTEWMIIHNSTTTTAAVITIVGATGTLLETSSTTGKIYPNCSALLRFVRKNNSDIKVEMTTYQGC